MRKLNHTILFFGVACGLAILAGCGSNIPDNYPKGAIDPGLYDKAVVTNEQRLAGEDVRVVPLYQTPLEALGAGWDALIGQPFTNLVNYITKDTAHTASREMLDPNNPDKRREGTLKLVDFEKGRQGAFLIVYAHVATDPDYTVRAAGLRALNRSRAKGYTYLFLKSLQDDQPLVRLQAVDALGNIPDPDAINDLVDHLNNDISPDVRISCADALRNFKNGEVASALVTVLDDRNFGVAWQARQSLELISGQDFRYDKNAWLDYFAKHGEGGS
jgi:hypothetical protein